MSDESMTLLLGQPEGASYREDMASLYGRTIAALFAEKVREDGLDGRRGVVIDDEVLPYDTNAAEVRALLWSLYFHAWGDLWRALGHYDAVDDGRARYPVALADGFVDNSAAVVAALAGGTSLPPRFAGIFARVTGARALPPPPPGHRRGVALTPPPACGAVLGMRVPVEQYGVLGRDTGAAVGVDLGGALAVAIDAWHIYETCADSGGIRQAKAPRQTAPACPCACQTGTWRETTVPACAGYWDHVRTACRRATPAVIVAVRSPRSGRRAATHAAVRRHDGCTTRSASP